MGDPTSASKWSVGATADNGAAAATRAAETGRAHYVTGLYASFSAANIKTLTLSDGTTTLTFHVHNQRDLVFAKPLKFLQGATVTATLAASGAGGQIGAVVLTGFTIGA